MKARWFTALTIVVYLAVLCAAPADAASVTRDLLGGLGGFENSCYSSWVSSYNGTSYDWNAAGRWSNGPSNGYRWGYNVATANDSVAEGWTRESGLNPDTNLVYKLVDNAGGKCQYFALKGVQSGYASAYLHSNFAVSKESYRLKVGDTVTFTLDSIKMENYSGLRLTYQITLNGVTGETASTILTPSSNPFSSSVTGKVASGATSVRASVVIQVSNGTGSRTPGIYVDGAHLTVRRGGSVLKEEVPVQRNRSIKTMKVAGSSADDPYWTAQNYDRVDLQNESDYWLARRLKYYNPNIKVYLYEGCWVTDWRESKYGGRDSIWSNSPVGMAFVLKHDADPDTPDWLYPDGNSWFSLSDKVYYAHLGDSTFQNVWTTNALAKAAAYKLDGIFIDGPNVKPPSGTFPGIEPWEANSLLHAVMASRPEGADIIHNMCAANLIRGFDGAATNDPWKRWPEQGLIFFDPSWKPDQTGEYTTANGYTANTADNTVDGMYQETAFWNYGGGQNWYNQTYAVNCLNDMDAVKKWNPGLPVNRQKWVHLLVHGADRPGIDDAYGIDGWVNFGLCSYLLGQNDWTTLGVAVTAGGQTVWPTAPFDETANLGEPASDRITNGSVGQRRYYGTDAGAEGGIVVANIAGTDSSAYSPEFDVVDQDGVFHPSGSPITLGAHHGRILYHQNNYKFVSVVTAPAEGIVITDTNYTIQGRVAANRPGVALPSIVQVKIDNGNWTDCQVDSDGNWSVSQDMSGLSQNSHTISSRAYISSSDYEPTKHSRTFSVKR